MHSAHNNYNNIEVTLVFCIAILTTSEIKKKVETTMTSLLKAVLHLLSIVVLCTAMAACSPTVGADYSAYSARSEAISGTASMLE